MYNTITKKLLKSNNITAVRVKTWSDITTVSTLDVCKKKKEEKRKRGRKIGKEKEKERGKEICFVFLFLECDV